MVDLSNIENEKVLTVKERALELRTDDDLLQQMLNANSNIEKLKEDIEKEIIDTIPIPSEEDLVNKKSISKYEKKLKAFLKG